MYVSRWDSRLPEKKRNFGEKFVRVLICVSPRASRLSNEKGQI